MRDFKPLSTSTARNLLENTKYDIEFCGCLTNHIKHAIIALDRLNAPESRVQEYWDAYTALTTYKVPLRTLQDWDTVPTLQNEEFQSLRGTKQKWQEQVAFLKKEFANCNNDMQTLARRFVPALLHGTAGSLTHSIIHLGWAIDADCPRMLFEGIAYLNFSHLGVNQLSDNADAYADEYSAMDSFVRVAKEFEEKELQTSWVDHAKAAYDESFHPELVHAPILWEIAKVIEEAHPVATDLPGWVHKLPVDSMFESMYRAVVWIYLSCKDAEGHGSLLVLHLITALWGLECTCKLIDDESVTREAVGAFYANAICIMAGAKFPSPSSLEEMVTKYPVEAVDTEDVWDTIVEKGIAEVEEHNIKLVYVTRELARRYGNWSGFVDAAKAFTLTPNVGPPH